MVDLEAAWRPLKEHSSLKLSFHHFSLRVFRSCRVPRFCSSRLQRKCNLCSRKRVVLVQASGKSIRHNRNPICFDKTHLFVCHFHAASLARRQSATNIKMRLLQENMLVFGMLNRYVIETPNRTHERPNRSNEKIIPKMHSGYRCEWCGMTTHGGCRAYISSDCTFGVLQPIYLPPHAVSIPRTEVPMEAIIGVQIKSKSTPLQRDYSCRKYSPFHLCLSWWILIKKKKNSPSWRGSGILMKHK